MLKLSKSRINTYIQCSKKYKYCYIDKIQVPTPISMIEGSALHAIVESVLMGTASPEQASDDFWSTVCLEETAYPDAASVETAKVSILNESNKFLSQIGQVDVYDVETYLEYPLTNIETGEIHPDIILRGFTDLMVHDGDATRIVDIKTSSRRPMEYQADRSFDLDVYGYLAALSMDLMPELQIPMSLLYLVRTREPKVMWLNSYRDTTDFIRLYDTVLNVAAGIQNGIFVRSQGFMCASCPYETMCYPQRSLQAA